MMAYVASWYRLYALIAVSINTGVQLLSTD